MSEYRECARGCTRARRHLAACLDQDACRGCQPREAEFGWLCYGCHKRLENLLKNIPGQAALLLAMADARGEVELSAPTTARLSAASPRTTTARDVRPLYAHRSAVVYGPSEPIRLACLDAVRELEDWLQVTVCLIEGDYQMAGPQEDTIASYAAWLLASIERLEWREDVSDRVFAPAKDERQNQSLGDIMSRAHSLAPWREQVARLHGIPCPECQATTLVKFGGDDDVTCIRCQATMDQNRYGIWTRMLADEHAG